MNIDVVNSRVGTQHFLHGDDESDRGVQKMK